MLATVSGVRWNCIQNAPILTTAPSFCRIYGHLNVSVCLLILYKEQQKQVLGVQRRPCHCLRWLLGAWVVTAPSWLALGGCLSQPGPSRLSPGTGSFHAPGLTTTTKLFTHFSTDHGGQCTASHRAHARHVLTVKDHGDQARGPLVWWPSLPRKGQEGVFRSVDPPHALTICGLRGPLGVSLCVHYVSVRKNTSGFLRKISYDLYPH